MIEQERLKLYLQLYEDELSHRQAINSSLGTAVAVLTLLGGGFVFLARNPPSDELTGAHWWFYALVALALITFVLAAYNFARSWFGRVYFYVTTPNEIEAWLREQRPYHDAHPEERPNLPERLEESLIAQVADNTTANRHSNRIKSEFAFFGRAWTLGTMLLLSLALVPYTAIRQQQQQDKSLDRIQLRGDTMVLITGHADKKDPPPPPPPPAPQKTPFPKPDGFREGSRQVPQRQAPPPVKPKQ